MFLTITQAAEKLQVCAKTISRRIKDGSISAHKLGHSTVRIDEKDLQEYIDKSRTA